MESSPCAGSASILGTEERHLVRLERQRRYYDKHKVRIRAERNAQWPLRRVKTLPKMHERWAKRREQALEKFGNKCVCCGITEKAFLTFDHIKGGGRQHRKRVGSYGFLLWLINEATTDEIQILCWNCNGAKRVLGYCPHQLKLSEQGGKNVVPTGLRIA